MAACKSIACISLKVVLLYHCAIPERDIFKRVLIEGSDIILFSTGALHVDKKNRQTANKRCAAPVFCGAVSCSVTVVTSWDMLLMQFFSASAINGSCCHTLVIFSQKSKVFIISSPRYFLEVL